MRAYLHDGQEPHALHPKAGYIGARPNYSILTDFSCNAPPVHTWGSSAGMPGTRSARLLYPWIAVAIVAPPRPSAPCQMLTSHTHHTNAKEDRMWGGPLKWKKGCDWRLC